MALSEEFLMRRRSAGLVEDDSERVSHAGADAADAVTEVHTVVALRPTHGPVVNGERYGVTLPKRYDLHATLHPRPLFGQDQLATCEIDVRLRQQDGNLDREGEIAVEILVEAVEVTRDVPQQQRCRTNLTRSVTSRKERCVIVGIALVDPHSPVPVVGYNREMRIERRPNAADEGGQRVCEVAILTLAEAVACHVNVAPEIALIGIEASDDTTFF
jgi:hypothetical protein